MKKTLITFLLLALLSPTLWAASAELTGVRFWDSPDGTRVILDTSKSADYSVFTLNNPKRVVIDLRKTALRTSMPNTSAQSLISKVRSGERNKGRDLRVVLDVTDTKDINSFSLQPQGQYGHRIVVDITAAASKRVFIPKPAPVAKNASTMREVVVAIDAGHGGEDPGASGKHGTREKDVVLAISKRLVKQLEKEKGIRPVMIRTGDYYLSLRKRIALARKHDADLFVSIHADAFKNRNVKGSSIYILSPRGASNETARWLAEKENAADLIGGVSIDDKDDMLAHVLLDLSVNGTIDVSAEVADSVLKEIGKVGPVHKRSVQSAGFVVLKSPDIPSMLIETAFISNPREERRLKDKRYQQKLAKSITKGIRSYFASNPPPGTVFAARGQQRAHVIRRGETLSGIAQQYRVSLASLKRENNIKGETIRVGQDLNIPSL
jgi:N-acetylmuramoyl-L-alanine amidase